MRKKTVKSGLKFMLAAMILVTLATFFSARVADLLFLGIGGEARFTVAGFFLAGVCGGLGVLVLAFGLVQAGSDERGVRLFPTVLVLFSLIVIFFLLAYTTITTHKPPALPRGESLTI